MNVIPRRRWVGKAYGELLALAEGKFDLFITADQGLVYEQNLRDRQIAILELSTNKLRAIEAVAAQLRDAIATMSGTEFRRLEIPL
jgi:hypothetical protein